VAPLTRLVGVHSPPPIEVLDPPIVAAYLDRLGVGGALDPTLETLRRVHRAHLLTVPFENLDIHLGVPIVLDARAIAEKIALRSRGGFCYEVNGALATLLASLGFEVRLLAARVHREVGLGEPFGHLALAVRIGDETFLADVGFGRGSFDGPMPLASAGLQHDGAGAFELRDAEAGALDLLWEGVPQYRVARAPRALQDFVEGCAFQQTSPASVFTQGTICTIRTASGRATIAGTRLIETTATDRRERALAGDELGEVLSERFGISLSAAELERLAGTRPSPIGGADG
jgi:N-hydroxyarylamine O-acetyltransferase